MCLSQSTMLCLSPPHSSGCLVAFVLTLSSLVIHSDTQEAKLFYETDRPQLSPKCIAKAKPCLPTRSKGRNTRIPMRISFSSAKMDPVSEYTRTFSEPTGKSSITRASLQADIPVLYYETCCRCLSLERKGLMQKRSPSTLILRFSSLSWILYMTPKSWPISMKEWLQVTRLAIQYDCPILFPLIGKAGYDFLNTPTDIWDVFCMASHLDDRQLLERSIQSLGKAGFDQRMTLNGSQMPRSPLKDMKHDQWMAASPKWTFALMQTIMNERAGSKSQVDPVDWVQIAKDTVADVPVSSCPVVQSRCYSRLTTIGCVDV